MADPILTSFEYAAEIAGDITPAIYERYFKTCPDSEALMSHIDELVRGRMMVEIFRLLMADDYQQEQAYLDFEVKNHKFAYSALPPMYAKLLQAVYETIKHSLAEQWTGEFEQAWQTRLSDLGSEIAKRA